MLYFLALFSLSTSANFAKLNQMPAEVLGFWRLSLATLALVVFQIARKNFEKIPFNRQTSWIYVSGFFFFLHLWTYKYASKHTLVSNTMVLFATNPVWASIGSWAFFKEPIARRVYVSYALALTGIILLVFRSVKFDPEQIAGNTSALVSAVFYALYMLSGKKARLHYSNKVYSTYQYLTCAILFLAVCMFNQQELFHGYSNVSWLSVAGLVLLPTFLGHYLLTNLVTKMNMAILSCGKLLEPIMASIMAFFIFHETLSSTIYISFLLTTISVIILFWPQITNYTRRMKQEGSRP